MTASVVAGRGGELDEVVDVIEGLQVRVEVALLSVSEKINCVKQLYTFYLRGRGRGGERERGRQTDTQTHRHRQTRQTDKETEKQTEADS